MMQRWSIAVLLVGAAAGLRVERRRVLLVGAPAAWLPLAASAESGSNLFSNVKAARAQLDPVPKLIEERKWDSIRAILITPPLSDCWARNARPWLRDYAAAVGNLPDGEELAVLEARDDAASHLRYLDMAAYNNVFSPAGGDAKVSASKELVKQFDELPRDELKQSIKALDDLVKLGAGFE